MQVKHRAIIVTILILVLFSILAFTTKAKYIDSNSSKPAESHVAAEEYNKVTENIDSDHFSILYVFDFTRTPAQTQTALSFLLLIPVGLLITALARSLVGIRTIGTFSPTLLALSQARSNWKIGILIFFITFGLGTLCRLLLVRFKLSTIPRRGVIGTFVVLLLAFAISFFHGYGLAPTARQVLLPVAVMTMMIERFFAIMEKEGNRTALTVLVNSLTVAVCCFLIFAYTQTGLILLRYPELELVIMVILLFIGRYTGRSLFEALGLVSHVSSE